MVLKRIEQERCAVKEVGALPTHSDQLGQGYALEQLGTYYAHELWCPSNIDKLFQLRFIHGAR